jgi:protein phosphatase
MKEDVVLQLAAKTSVGKVRELNEDNFIVTNNISGANWFLPAEAYSNAATGTVMVVADGMGGTNAGEVASQIAVESVRKYFNALSSSPVKTEQVRPILKDAILYAHRAIVSYAAAHPETQGMGTTLLIGWIVEGKAYVGWSGDSRCYLWNPERGLRQVSKDHSYVQSLVDEGKITQQQAFDHPQNNIVLQSLGDELISPVPDVTEVRIAKDDCLLICSDGLSGMMTDAEIEEALRLTQGDIGSAVNVLVDRANEAGGVDNITVVVARVLENTFPVDDTQPEEDWGRTGDGRQKKGKGRLFGLSGLAVVVIGLVAYIYIHGLQQAGNKLRNDPSQRDSGGLVRPHVRDSARMAPAGTGGVEEDSAGTKGSGAAGGDQGTGGAAGGEGHGGAGSHGGHGHTGVKPATPKNQSPDESDDPSATKGGQSTPQRAGDGHPLPGNGGKVDSSKHSHDAGEVVKPGGAPVPAGSNKEKPAGKGNGDGHPQKPSKKDSTKKDNDNNALTT